MYSISNISTLDVHSLSISVASATITICITTAVEQSNIKKNAFHVFHST